MALFTVKDKLTGATVEVFDTRHTFVANEYGGLRTSEFYVYDIRIGSFKWVLANLFTSPGTGDYDPTVRVQDVTLDKFNATVDVGGSPITFTATIVPDDAANKNVTWEISDPDYATITPSGNTCSVSAVRPGRATLTVTTEDNNRTADAQIFILSDEVYINQIDFLPAEPRTMGVGDYGTLTALTAPSNAANRVVSFAVVDGGDKIRISPISNNYITLYALEEGTAHIRATALDDGHYSADYTINIIAATTANVGTYAEFVAAASNPDIININLTSDIVLEDTISIARTVHIDGQNHILTYNGTPKDALVIMGNTSIVKDLIMNFSGDPSEWRGLYGLQVYNATEVILNGITCHGEDGGILINGSTVTLVDNIDVSGNEFGGIEVSRGTQATRNSTLNVTNATFTNTTESYAHPTIWVENGQGEVVGGGGFFTIELNNQTQYYLEQEHTIPPEPEVGPELGEGDE